MLNRKKFEMAFKRYKKNWIAGTKDAKEEYEELQSEITDIVQSNAIERDHILLIDLDTICSYYISKWKDDVLINGGNTIEQFKKIQMVVFYECMGQDIYKIRYPNMRRQYTFKEVIAALIHFTMFGWKKEENILFDFIVEHLGENIMSANDCNKHTWFLLELYLQYRNKTILGTNQKLHITVKETFKKAGLECYLIPEDLDVYREVLELWSTCNLEEFENLISKMSLFHSTLASELEQSLEFGDFMYTFYPFEILFLVYIRNKLCLPVPKQFDDLLMNTPEAKMVIGDSEPYPEWDHFLRLIDIFYRKNYPGYIPNKHGELFK
jgi:chaperonin cofactor prefoldin